MSDIHPTACSKNQLHGRELAVIEKQLTLARAANQRRLVVLTGEQSWANAIVNAFVKTQADLTFIRVGADDSVVEPDNVQSINNKQAITLLGQEIDGLIIDAWCGVHPNALAAATGTLRGGGLLFLLVPPFNDWSHYSDPDYQRLLVHPFTQDQLSRRFIAHLQTSLLAAENCLLIASHNDESVSVEQWLNTSSDKSQVGHQHQAVDNKGLVGNSDGCLTEDQQLAVDAIVKLSNSRPHRPLVITADRGRGKSSALGIASAKILQGGNIKIIITAPRIEAVQATFERAAELLDSTYQKNHLTIHSSELLFVAVDDLIRNDYSADLLLIDEAAAIPAPMLTQLLTRFNRIVFSSTVHGYEGTGRGFDIRFRKTLNEITPQWKSLTLSAAIRWADDDPVERWLADALLLKVNPVDDKKIKTVESSHCVTECLNRDELVSDKELLTSLFGLLVQAHYQTSPDDLRNLLDGPNVSVWVTRYQGLVVAAALVAAEGGLDENLSVAIWRGERRPRGHLIPQTLACHSGFQQAPLMRYQRVMRIAVHPSAQRRGLGQQLINEIVNAARDKRVDFIGTSFAATDDVVAFWEKLQLQPVRLGVSRDASSGCHSLVMLSALSVDGNRLLADLHTRFLEQLYYELPLMYQQLETELVVLLLKNENGSESSKLSQQDYLDVQAFVEGHRQLETCRMALSKFIASFFASNYFSDVEKLASNQVKVLVQIILQSQTINSVVRDFNYSGKKDLVETLRSTVSVLFHH